MKMSRQGGPGVSVTDRQGCQRQGWPGCGEGDIHFPYLIRSDIVVLFVGFFLFRGNQLGRKEYCSLETVEHPPQNTHPCIPSEYRRALDSCFVLGKPNFIIKLFFFFLWHNFYLLNLNTTYAYNQFLFSMYFCKYKNIYLLKISKFFFLRRPAFFILLCPFSWATGVCEELLS